MRGDMEEAGAQAVGFGLSSLYKQLDSMGFQSGGEFFAAVDEADRIGASIHLGDRDARVTVRRLRDALAEVLASPDVISGKGLPPPPAALVKAGASQDFNRENVLSTMQVLKQRENVRELSAYLQTAVPPLYTALIAERDAFMAQSLLGSSGQKIVAVVGLAHVDGIERAILAQGKRGALPRECGAREVRPTS
jgi:pheromone shutdown protein TraB